MCSLSRYSDPGLTVRTAEHSGGNMAWKENATIAANLFWRPMIGQIYCPTTKMFRTCPTNRAVRRGNTRFHRVCHDAYERFLEIHVQVMEEDLRQRDRRGLFQPFKSLNIENTRNVNSQYIRDEEVIMLGDPGLVLGRWARFFGTLLNSKSDKLILDIIEGSPIGLSHTLLGSNGQKTS